MSVPSVMKAVAARLREVQLPDDGSRLRVYCAAEDNDDALPDFINEDVACLVYLNGGAFRYQYPRLVHDYRLGIVILGNGGLYQGLNAPRVLALLDPVMAKLAANIGTITVDGRQTTLAIGESHNGQDHEEWGELGFAAIEVQLKVTEHTRIQIGIGEAQT